MIGFKAFNLVIKLMNHFFQDYSQLKIASELPKDQHSMCFGKS